MLNTLKRITESPYLNIVIGLLMFYSGASEAWNELHELEEVTVGAHHGVILFSLLHILKTIPDIFEGLEHIQK
ncbi:MAG: hypothetical protein KJO08_11445 [Gammaproteobacteria bacterium]|nr:hypothetical protein [Gammaproteobacteria bacterium]NNJ85399.1 hypothetical protein [Gammaproteobacteria bacterium]